MAEDADGQTALRYAIVLADHCLMALVGLGRRGAGRADERVRSLAIITTLANELHDRMPVVLSAQNWPAWLGEEPADPARLKSMLAPYSSEGVTCWPVSARVGNVKNNDPSLIEPIAVGYEAESRSKSHSCSDISQNGLRRISRPQAGDSRSSGKKGDDLIESRHRCRPYSIGDASARVKPPFVLRKFTGALLPAVLPGARVRLIFLIVTT